MTRRQGEGDGVLVKIRFDLISPTHCRFRRQKFGVSGVFGTLLIPTSVCGELGWCFGTE